jgi:hypothetical protein
VVEQGTHNPKIAESNIVSCWYEAADWLRGDELAPAGQWYAALFPLPPMAAAQQLEHLSNDGMERHLFRGFGEGGGRAHCTRGGGSLSGFRSRDRSFKV